MYIFSFELVALCQTVYGLYLIYNTFLYEWVAHNTLSHKLISLSFTECSDLTCLTYTAKTASHVRQYMCSSFYKIKNMHECTTFGKVV